MNNTFKRILISEKRMLHLLKVLSINLYQKYFSLNIGILISSLSFSTITSMVPVTTLFIGVFWSSHYFKNALPGLTETLSSNLLPYDTSEKLIKYLISFSDNGATALTYISGIFLLVTSISLLSTLEGIFNIIFEVEKHRTIVQKIKLYILFLISAPIVLGILISIISYFISMSSNVFKNQLGLSIIETFIIKSTVVFFLSFCFYMLYKTMPNRKVNFKIIICVAFFIAILFIFLQKAFSIYLASFSNYTVIYGAFSFIPISLLWIYTSWFLLVFGGMLIIEIEHMSHIYNSHLKIKKEISTTLVSQSNKE